MGATGLFWLRQVWHELPECVGLSFTFVLPYGKVINGTCALRFHKVLAFKGPLSPSELAHSSSLPYPRALLATYFSRKHVNTAVLNDTLTLFYGLMTLSTSVYHDSVLHVVVIRHTVQNMLHKVKSTVKWDNENSGHATAWNRCASQMDQLTAFILVTSQTWHCWCHYVWNSNWKSLERWHTTVLWICKLAPPQHCHICKKLALQHSVCNASVYLKCVLQCTQDPSYLILKLSTTSSLIG